MLKAGCKLIADLVLIDQRTGKLSHTKFLSVLASLVMIAMFPYVVITGQETEVELWLVFGALFLSNRTVNKWLDKKYGLTEEQK